MPVLLRCDAPGCGKEVTAKVCILGRPQAPDGFRFQTLPGRGQARIVIACSDAHLTDASRFVASTAEISD